MKNELTPEERSKPYSKYFYRDPVLPSAEQLAVMEKPINPAKALRIEYLNDLLNHGYLDVEAGWCVMPNGSAYVANHTKMLGVSLDMIKWWFAWHSLEDIRYKIWWPKGHFAISVSDEDRNKVLDSNRPLVQKFQGITHRVVEDIGGGPENIIINFLTPEDAGFDMVRFRDRKDVELVAANGRTRPVNAWPIRPWAPAFMCHFIREIPGGIEFRTRFWMGYQMVNRKPKLKLPPFGIIKVPREVPQGLAIHNVHEYTNLASFLPQLYEEQKGIIA